jgi:hypothetical protein
MNAGLLANAKQAFANLRAHGFAPVDFDIALAARHQQASCTEHEQR